jgi:hypothetical protein
VKRVTNSEDYLKEEERSCSSILITEVMKWAVDIRATVFHLKRKGIRAHRKGHCIALTLTATLPNVIYYFFHLTLSTIDLLVNLKMLYTYHRR